MKIDDDKATAVVREAAASLDRGDQPNAAWVTKVEKLSELCAASSRTHMAFFGTVAIAKSVNKDADLFAIKPEHAGDNKNAFSARILSENVLVPLSAEIGFNIGTTGRQPLNNQPYFRMTRLGDNTPVQRKSLPAFTYMLELVKELAALKTEAEAQAVLRAFIFVRKKHQLKYSFREGGSSITPEQLIAAVSAFVTENSEGGKRAQAVVAGFMDIFAGVDAVESGRINDPSRKYPGDVCVRDQDSDELQKAIEVRDKPVSANDVQIFAKKCIDMGAREAAVVMVSEKQPKLDSEALDAWAVQFGIGVTLFHGWKDFIEQVLFWCDQPKPEATNEAVGLIRDRLVLVEVSPAGVDLWDKLATTKTSS
ncbi:MAG: restriction endonuclease, SacI family [Xanthobacteraceae bacterium]|nr:MAG: restriction endonuclease, SacI family [Xanthobacteraceae bacterium]